MSKLFLLAFVLFIIGCTKENKDRDIRTVPEELATAKATPPKPPTYVAYTIRKGQHYCDQNSLKSVKTSEMKFIAKFDNSAIYQAVLPENQYDIHKLWGFSEGFNNQYNSARIGWSWNNDALRLYGYVYAKGVRYYQENNTGYHWC